MPLVSKVLMQCQEPTVTTYVSLPQNYFILKEKVLPPGGDFILWGDGQGSWGNVGIREGGKVLSFPVSSFFCCCHLLLVPRRLSKYDSLLC